MNIHLNIIKSKKKKKKSVYDDDVLLDIKKYFNSKCLDRIFQTAYLCRSSVQL